MLGKKIGAVSLSSAIVLAGVLPAFDVSAASKITTVIEEVSQQATVAENIVDVEQEKLIEKLRTLFPEKFNFVADQDFRVDFHPYGIDENTQVYNLHFFKEIGNGKYIDGNFGFAGKDLALVSYNYSPQDLSDAIYPPKVSKEDAQAIAAKFLANMVQNEKYRLSEDNYMYNFGMNRPLTEPVEYHFLFDKLENGIPVLGQTVNVTVLGNGEVSQFYKGSITENATYESAGQVVSKEDALAKLNGQLALDLQYWIDRDHLENKSNVALTYVSNPPITGVHAKTGEIKIGDSYLKTMPAKQQLKMLADGPLNKSVQPLTKEQARAIAEKILAPKEENVKLLIENVQEIERNGIQVYSIDYMYRTGSSGHGSSFQINKQTGEITSYHNITSNELEFQANKDSKPTISKEEALKKAVDNVKEYAYQNMNQHAYPMESQDNNYQTFSNDYYFYFPRIKNGLIVGGNGISVSVSAKDGKLLSLNTNFDQMNEWPDVKAAITVDKAMEPFKDNLDLKLFYTNSETNRDHYNLSYILNMKKKDSYFNALTGKWEKQLNYMVNDDQTKKTQIEHPWAAEELNFLIEANIIQVKDPATFNPNQSVARGEALEIIYKSLSRFYNYRDVGENKSQTNTFENIKQDHPLFEIVERAAIQEIIDSSSKTFDIDQKLTREELAFWYARALGLQIVAEQDDLYKFDFADVKEMNNQYKGHIALMNALDVLQKDANNEFNPHDEVTLAELAVSTIRLAKLATEMNIEFQ